MTDTLRASTLRLRNPVDRPPVANRQKIAAVTTVRSSSSSTHEGGARQVRSDTLLQGQSYVSIMHNGETYQLRATRLGKLILTK